MRTKIWLIIKINSPWEFKLFKQLYNKKYLYKKEIKWQKL